MNRAGLIAAGIAVLAFITGCSAPPEGGVARSTTDVPPSGSPDAGSGTAGRFPRCEDVPAISAPADWYRDSPIYVGNEMPVDAVRAWAERQTGFQDLWIDRQHNGWITVAFSEGAEARQAEIEREFPEDGVVAVDVDWTSADFEDLQERIRAELGRFRVNTSDVIDHGVVSVWLGVLSDERIAALEAGFAGEPLCIEGANPADLPQPGPQALAGDGWRLLIDERTGNIYRTGVAWDQDSLAALWREIPLEGEPPVVDFASEVVIWFGAVHSSSCPNIRLDGVAFDPARRLIHADIVNTDIPGACTADALPRAYVVAVDRDRLPPAPFWIQLTAADPPAGAPEERTVVDADLRVPGSVAASGQVHADPNIGAPQVEESGTFVEPDFPRDYRLHVHCGIEWLGVINDITWRTDVPADSTGFVPPEWEPLVADESIVVSVLLEAGDPPTITASTNGHEVIYVPTSEPDPGCD
jgi:hypothetical protein